MFNAQDLEDLYCCGDDELIGELTKRYKISAPADIVEEYEEERKLDFYVEGIAAITSSIKGIT